MARRCRELVGVLDGCDGHGLQQRWEDFEARVWPGWVAGQGRLGGDLWRWGTWAAVLSRAVRPSWPFMATGRVGQWLGHLPADDALVEEAGVLKAAMAAVGWVGDGGKDIAVLLGLRVLLVAGVGRRPG